MKYSMKLKNDPFNKIKDLKKKIELRLNDEKRKLLNVGDIIEFTNVENQNKMLVEVIGLDYYSSFDELYKNYDKELLGYDENEVKDPKDMEAYYSIEEQKKIWCSCNKNKKDIIYRRSYEFKRM